MKRFALYSPKSCRRDHGTRSIRGRGIVEATWFQGYMGERARSQLSVQRGMAVWESFVTAVSTGWFRISLCHSVQKPRLCDIVSNSAAMKLGCARKHRMKGNAVAPRLGPSKRTPRRTAAMIRRTTTHPSQAAGTGSDHGIAVILSPRGGPRT